MTDAVDGGIGDAVRLVIELQLGRESVTMEQRLAEDLEADSFDVMNIIAILEEDHRITISEEAAAATVTVGDLVRLVESLGTP